MALYRLLLVLHLLGAAIWVGGHLVLALAVLPRALRRRDPRIVSDFESGYERLGLPALAVQIATGLYLTQYRVPSVAAWFSAATPQSRYILLKLGLLAATLLLALHARLRVVPHLEAKNLRFLAWHIAVITLLGIGFVIAGVGLQTGGLL